MSVLRLQGGGKSYSDIEWDVKLYGPDISATVINAHLGADVFSLRYEGGEADINTPIIPSSLSFQILAKTDTELVVNESLLNEIALADEGDFIVKVYKDTVLWWVGLVLADQIQFADDRLPRPFTIRAVDGLARLKEIEFNQDGEEFTVDAYLSQHITIALKKTGLYDQLTVGLKACTSWTCDENTLYDSFLEGIRLRHIVWLYIDSKGSSTTTTQKRSKTAWEVLEMIAKTFHARVFMTLGSFWFVQIPSYSNVSTARIHSFNSDGAVTSYETGLPITYSNSYDQAMGAYWQYQAAIKRVKVTYKHESAKNVALDLNFVTGPITITDVDSFSGTGKVYLSFTLSYPTVLNSTTYPTYLSHAHKFLMRLKIGDRWLVRTSVVQQGQITYGDPFWSTTAADYEFFVNPNYNFNGQNRYNFSLVTPPFPASGDAVLSLSYERTYFFGGSTSPTAISGFEWFVTNGNFQVIPEGLIDGAFNETTFTDESLVGASKEVPIISTFGDGPYSYTLTTMRARRTEGTPFPITENWNGSARSGGIHEVLAASIIRYNGKVAKKLNQPFIGGSYTILNLLESSGKFYMIISGDFNARGDTWNAVFTELIENTNRRSLPPKKYQNRIPQPGTGSGISGNEPQSIPPQLLPDDRQGNEVALAKADVAVIKASVPTITSAKISAGTVTSVQITTLSEANVFVAGDKVNVTDAKTGKTTAFTVNTNNAAGATSLAVDSTTIANDIVDSSAVQLDAQTLYKRTGAANRFWSIAGSATTDSTGKFTVTHGLGTSALVIVASCQDSSAIATVKATSWTSSTATFIVRNFTGGEYVSSTILYHILIKY